MTQRNPSLTIGMDVSDRYCEIAMLDDSGVVVLREQLRTRPADLSDFFKVYPGVLVVLEVGPHSPWISRLLEELPLDVVVGNPRKIGLISGNDRKSDRVDAEFLARIGRVDRALLFPVQHRRADTQAVLAMLRSRSLLVDTRARLVNSVRGQVKALGERLPACSTAAFSQRVAPLIPELLRDAMGPLLDVIAELGAKIAHLDKVVEELCRDVYPETAQLQQIPGVGPITALCFFLTIEEPGRFRSSRQVGSYLGLRPRQDESGESSKELPVTKAGDKLCRRLLVQSAHYILGPFGPDSDLRRWGLKLAARGGRAAKRKAVIAVARKLAVLLHSLWVSGEEYEPLRNSTLAEAA